MNSVLISQEKEYYFNQYQLMQESVEKVKSIRHDTKMHLAVLRDFIIKGNMGEAIGYINSLLEDIGENEIYSETGNLAFDSIINYKLKDIIKSDIELDMRLQIPPNINMDNADIVTIMGNLLDNSLEAMAKANEKKIDLTVVLNNGMLLIKVENSFNGVVKYLDKWDKKDKIHKRGKKAEIVSLKNCEHGYGLKNIKRSVDKYDGYVKFAHKGNVFSAKILIALGDN